MYPETTQMRHQHRESYPTRWTWRWSLQPLSMMGKRKRSQGRPIQQDLSSTDDTLTSVKNSSPLECLNYITTRDIYRPSCSIVSEHSDHGVDVSLGCLRQGDQRGTDTPRPWRKGISAGIIKVVTVLVMWPLVRAADITTDYLKPTVSSKGCMNTVELIAAKSEDFGNGGACMQCDPANNVCPQGCQALIDDLYLDCDGVTTPDGLYYDPSNKIDGKWSDHVKAAIKIATERCGCNRAGRLKPTEATFFGTSEFRYLYITGLLALTALVAMTTSMTYYVFLP